MIVTRKDFPAKDLKEFIAYLKQNGQNVKQAHGGIGASSHMACLLFTAEAGVAPNLVAYRGTGPAMNDLVGGHVDEPAALVDRVRAEAVAEVRKAQFALFQHQGQHEGRAHDRAHAAAEWSMRNDSRIGRVAGVQMQLHPSDLSCRDSMLRDEALQQQHRYMVDGATRERLDHQRVEGRARPVDPLRRAGLRDGIRVRGARSSANPLLETAAPVYGPRLIVAVLSGGDGDATDGVQVESQVTGLRLVGIAFDSKTLRIIAEADGIMRALVTKIAVQ